MKDNTTEELAQHHRAMPPAARLAAALFSFVRTRKAGAELNVDLYERAFARMIAAHDEATTATLRAVLAMQSAQLTRHRALRATMRDLANDLINPDTDTSAATWRHTTRRKLESLLHSRHADRRKRTKRYKPPPTLDPDDLGPDLGD
jgi:hypothetical protein